MKKTNFLIVFLLFVTSVTLHAQQDSSAFTQMYKYVQNIATFNRLVPQEKVYLHFDNTSYVLGETIWFKGYVVTAGKLQPTNQSGVLYVELLNAKGKVLETKKLKIEEGQCRGEFVLEEINIEYFPGFYEIRAYTKGMLNFGEKTVFSRVFPVFKELKINGGYTQKDLEDGLEIQLPNHRKKAKKQNKVNLAFYPEGGNLINGLTSKVAFQMTDEEGSGLEATGIVTTQEGETLTDFSTIYDGMGWFSYTPDGRKNAVKVTYENKEYTFDLPASLEKGYLLQVDNSSESSLIVQVEQSPNLIASTLGVSVLCRGEVSFFRVITLGGSEPKILKIPKEDLSSGVNQITLFDTKGEIFAERMLFIPPQDEEQVVINAVPDKAEYAPQEKISIDFAITGESVYPETVLSVAVRDANQVVQTADAGNITTNLLLSSDLKGYIENPSWYLEKENAQALDLLLLVRGWKRYEWQTMAGVKPFNPPFNIEKGLTVKGYLATSDGKNTNITLRMQQDPLRMKETGKTDAKGIFYFYPEDCYGTWEVMMISKAIEKGAKNIRLDQWFSPNPQPYSFQETAWAENPLGIVKKSKKEKKITEIKSSTDSITRQFLIPEVLVQTRRQRNKDLIYNVGTDIDRAIDLGKKIPYTVNDYMLENDSQYEWEYDETHHQEEMERDATNNIFRNESPFINRNSYYNSHLSNTGTVHPTILYYNKPRRATFYHLYDGKWRSFSEQTFRTGKRTYDVARRSMTTNRFIVDVQKIVIPGVQRYNEDAEQYTTPINIYPFKHYEMRNIQGTRYTTFEGYSRAKDFYWDRKERENYVPSEYEHQRTLYWNPDLKTDNQGEAHIYFYNTALCRQIDISAEGLTKDEIPIVIKK